MKDQVRRHFGLPKPDLLQHPLRARAWLAVRRWIVIPDHVRVVGNGSRAAIISDRRITGLSAEVIAELVAEVGPLWQERHQARLESRPRKRAVGGAKHRLVFIDRLLATLVHLRHGATHDVLACWFDVDRSTITRAIGEVRPLLAARGCTIAAGIRLRTLAEVIGHLGTSGQTGIIDGTEIRVRRPAVGRKDREKFISGKNKQNAVKAMVLTDASGRLLFCSPAQPASCADITHARQLGLVKTQFTARPSRSWPMRATRGWPPRPVARW